MQKQHCNAVVSNDLHDLSGFSPGFCRHPGLVMSSQDFHVASERYEVVEKIMQSLDKSERFFADKVNRLVQMLEMDGLP